MSAAHTGIHVRHSRSCRSLGGGRCTCTPTYQAHVFDKRTGSRIRRTFPTLAAAKAWRQDAVVDIRRGVMRGPSGVTLKQAADDLLAGMESGAVTTKSGARYKPSVIAGYRAALDKRVTPALGGHPLERIDRPIVQAFVDRLVGEGLDPSTLRNVLMPLRVIYRRALVRGLVAVNPTTGLELAAVTGQRDRFATPDEAARLVEALPAAHRALWATAFYAGLRAGELAGLDWTHVDLAAGVIRVERAWDPKSRVYVDPKSKAGRRKVPIPAVLRDHLVDHKMTTGGEGLVWRARHGGPFNASTVAVHARTAWEAAGLEPITLHECRHTFASLMIAAGVNAKALSVYMGHSNIGITYDRYGHLMPGSEDEAAALLDAYLERADTKARLAALQ